MINQCVNLPNCNSKTQKNHYHHHHRRSLARLDCSILYNRNICWNWSEVKVSDHRTRRIRSLVGAERRERKVHIEKWLLSGQVEPNRCCNLSGWGVVCSVHLLFSSFWLGFGFVAVGRAFVSFLLILFCAYCFFVCVCVMRVLRAYNYGPLLFVHKCLQQWRRWRRQQLILYGEWFCFPGFRNI